MATAITASNIKSGFETEIPDAQIDLLIAVVDEADTCLDNNSVSDERQEVLKTAAVRHMLTMMGAAASGKGAVTSEGAPSGASRSYRPPKGGDLMASSYGAMLKQLDKNGCVVTLLENTQRLSLRSIGRRDPDVDRPTYG